MADAFYPQFAQGAAAVGNAANTFIEQQQYLQRNPPSSNPAHPNVRDPANRPNPKGGPLSGPGYGEDWYKQYGQDLMNGPSASEKLYAEGAAGSNPFYDNAQQVVDKSINDAAAARGNFNSSFTLRNLATANADLRGQQAHELGQLAGQADTGRFGRYDRGAGYSERAQGLMEGRANEGINQADRLANGQAGLVNGFYSTAGQESQQAYMARIEAMLKQAGIPLEVANQALQAWGSATGTAVKAISAGSGGGGGGGGNDYAPV